MSIKKSVSPSFSAAYLNRLLKAAKDYHESTFNLKDLPKIENNFESQKSAIEILKTVLKFEASIDFQNSQNIINTSSAVFRGDDQPLLHVIDLDTENPKIIKEVYENNSGIQVWVGYDGKNDSEIIFPCKLFSSPVPYQGHIEALDKTSVPITFSDILLEKDLNCFVHKSNTF